MSRGINKVILIGNLGRDPEISYTPTGMAVARMSLATTEGKKKDDGTWEDVTEWHRIVVFGRSAETASQYYTKGQQLYIEGKIHYDSYEKDGVKRYSTDIVAHTIRQLGRREEGAAPRSTEGGGYPPASTPPQSNGMPDGDIEDDLPF
jgi:single-strand DNA-binding protein